jgi:hypothetical protein
MAPSLQNPVRGGNDFINLGLDRDGPRLISFGVGMNPIRRLNPRRHGRNSARHLEAWGLISNELSAWQKGLTDCIQGDCFEDSKPWKTDLNNGVQGRLYSIRQIHDKTAWLASDLLVKVSTN